MAQTRVGVRQRPTSNIITDGLVLHLDAGNAASYSGTGVDWYDLTSNDNDGMLVNGPTYDSGNGGTISFDGVNDYVDVPAIQPTRFTLSSWFKAVGAPSNNDSAGGMLIAANPQMFGGGLDFYLSHSWALQCIRFGVQGNNIATSNNSALNNQIYNAVATYDGTTIKIYVNGELAISRAHTKDPIYPTSGDINVKIGKWGYGPYQRNLNGNIYSSQIYNRALTESEIQQNYNATKGRFGL
jgi:hypothetical protein